MVDEVSKNSAQKFQVPYKLSDVKSCNFNDAGGIFFHKFEPSFKLEKSAVKKTSAQELYESWNNVTGNLSQDFFDGIVKISKNVKCNPEDLAALMYHESNFDPKTQSADKRFHGLIQFDERSLKAAVKNAYDKNLNIPNLDKDINIEKLNTLSREEQLPYVEAYLSLAKDYCGLKNKKLTGGELWGMIKSPKQTKTKNTAFLNKVQNQLDSIKTIPLKYEIPFYLQKRD